MLNFLLISLGYLIGSIPSGYLAGKWLKGIDLREKGSGSTGATNVLRHVGKRPAIVVFFVDVCKGMAPILIAKFLMLNDHWQVLTGLAALAGHIWPLWLNWKGGKAVATGLGMFLGLSWAVGLACLGVFLTVLALSKIVSLSSLIAAISLPLLMAISFGQNDSSPSYLLVSMISAIMIVWRHRSNIKRLIEGREPHIGESL